MTEQELLLTNAVLTLIEEVKALKVRVASLEKVKRQQRQALIGFQGQMRKF